MSKPYSPNATLEGRVLTPAERLEPQRAGLRHAVKLLEQFERTLERAGRDLTESDLEVICKAVDAAHAAAANACFLGDPDYHAQPVEMVRWEDRTGLMRGGL